MRRLEVAAPHFTDRVAEAEQLVVDRDHTPELNDADREMLRTVLRGSTHAIRERGAPEQLLHGEPHPGNVLSTANGPLFIDLETSCHGPIEFDLAHVPEEVSALYADADEQLLTRCRGLVLAMVAAWRWDRDDEFPDGRRARQAVLRAVREGPPWPTLDAVMRDARDP
jgi:hypothetical protein